MGKKKGSRVAVFAILGIPVLLFLIGGISMKVGIEYTGVPDVHCNRVNGTTTCDDPGETGSQIAVLVTGSDEHAIVRSEPAVWTARVAFGLVVLGFGTWIVLGLIQGARSRGRYRRIVRRKEALP